MNTKSMEVTWMPDASTPAPILKVVLHCSVDVLTFNHITYTIISHLLICGHQC
jgi:hypothetical protein